MTFTNVPKTCPIFSRQSKGTDGKLLLPEISISRTCPSASPALVYLIITSGPFFFIFLMTMSTLIIQQVLLSIEPVRKNICQFDNWQLNTKLD